MKKSVIAIGLAVFLCLSFWFGGFVQKQKNEQAREQSYEKLIGFAVHKIEALKTPQNESYPVVLACNLYAAREFCRDGDDGELYNALSLLWNAVLFDADGLAGREDALIAALQESDVPQIEAIAVAMRADD